MDIVIAAIKSDLNSVLDAGRYMLTGLFIVAVFNSYVGILSKNINWTDVILRLVIGFVLLQNYTWVMDTTRDIVVGLDQRISPDQSAIDQYAQMNDNMQKQYQQNTQQSFVSQVKDFLLWSFAYFDCQSCFYFLCDCFKDHGSYTLFTCGDSL